MLHPSYYKGINLKILVLVLLLNFSLSWFADIDDKTVNFFHIKTLTMSLLYT